MVLEHCQDQVSVAFTSPEAANLKAQPKAWHEGVCVNLCAGFLLDPGFISLGVGCGVQLPSGLCGLWLCLES